MRIILFLIFLFMIGYHLKGQTVKLSTYEISDPNTAIGLALSSSIDTIVIDQAGSPWIFAPVKIHGINNKTILIEPNVEIFAKRGAFPQTNDALFTFIDSDNLRFIGNDNVLAMNKQEYTDGEWRHILSLRGCRNFVINNVVLKDSGGDGLYIAGSSSRENSSNIRINNVICLNNKRQGISVISVNGLYVLNSEFSNTVGTLPGAGVDIEPNHKEDIINDIFFTGCIFQNNFNSGIKVALSKLDSSSHPIKIQFNECVLRNNHSVDNPRVSTEISISAHKSNAVKGELIFENCLIENSDWGFLYSRKNAEAFIVKFINCSAINICKSGKMPAIGLEVPDYYNKTPDLGGFIFQNMYIKYNSSSPFFFVRGSRSGTLKHLRDVNGNITLNAPKISESGGIQYINYDPSNNIRVNIDVVRKSFN